MGKTTAVVLVVLLAICLIQNTSAQSFIIETMVESTSSLSLELLSEPSVFGKETWLNWTLQMTVLEWNPEWNTSQSWDHPSLNVLVRSSAVNFTEYNNVSFGLNLTDSWIHMSVKFIHYLHVFTSYDMGNLTGVVRQTYFVSVKFAEDMPTTSYTLEISIYDPKETSTTTTSTPTTTSPTTPTTPTTTTPEQPSNLYFLPIIIGSVLIVFIVVLIIRIRR